MMSRRFRRGVPRPVRMLDLVRELAAERGISMREQLERAFITWSARSRKKLRRELAQLARPLRQGPQAAPPSLEEAARG
jgi:hypothetical protein